MKNDQLEIWTIGHSTASYEAFRDRLRAASVTAIADVRSAPYSRQFPHFNKDAFREALRSDDIAYVFLGKELGGRPREKQFYCERIADYEKMAQAEDFLKGVERLIEGARKFKIAIMCSEQDPLDCHRCLLVGRVLHERGVAVRNILADESIVDQVEIENQLLTSLDGRSEDLFESRAARIAAAYRKRSLKVAYAEPESGSATQVHTEKSR